MRDTFKWFDKLSKTGDSAQDAWSTRSRRSEAIQHRRPCNDPDRAGEALGDGNLA